MENYIPISYLNDYIFCPRSIYNHQLYQGYEELVYQGVYQTEGKNAHIKIDNQRYSDRNSILQNFEIVSAHYGIYGKIDLFDVEKGLLSERKKNIKTIYDGYVFQVYAQYFGLTEMGYVVKEIVLYDFSKNKKYPIALPHQNPKMFQKFEQTIHDLKNYSLLKNNVIPNEYKCEKCIYKQLCDLSLC